MLEGRKKRVQMITIWIASVAAFSLLFHPFALAMELAESSSNSNSNNNNNTRSSSKNQELLAREIDQLHARIIKATNADEDIAFTTRLELKKQLASLHDKELKAELLSEITQWWTELPPLQNLVRKQIKNDETGIDELLDLLSHRKLTQNHPRFLALIHLQ